MENDIATQNTDPWHGEHFATAYSYAYDYMSRRVAKWTPSHTTTFVYDGWNLIMEIHNSTIPPFQSSTKQYYWGNDLSGTEQGAGGVGGLLAVSIDGAYYLPCYDNNGNITAYVNEQGVVVAQYTYDAFGATITQSGSHASHFPHRFSTKYRDHETGLYYYGCRFYDPLWSRWLNRDPIEEDGGINLYAFVLNDPVNWIDLLGLRTYSIGPESEPSVTFDEDFVFDPSERVTWRDRLSWLRWGAQLAAAEAIGHLADATRLYRHYRSGAGTDIKIDYEKAHDEDAKVRLAIQNAIAEAQREAERLAASNPTSFEMNSDAGSAGHYPETENWQKAIGAHLIWGYAVVECCGDKFEMSLRMHELDRYNFNRGASDIATGAPDNANGRFAVLGWARSFLTRGTVERIVTWERGDIPGTTDVDEGRSRRGRGRGRPRGR